MPCELIKNSKNTHFSYLSAPGTDHKSLPQYKRKTLRDIPVKYHYIVFPSTPYKPTISQQQQPAHMDQTDHSNSCAALLPLATSYHSYPLYPSHLSYPLPSPPSYINERLCLVYAAVSMVEQSGRRKVSVRRAAAHFGVPKSTVHRHLQVHRGIIPRRRSPTSTTRLPPRKCDINFLIHPEDHKGTIASNSPPFQMNSHDFSEGTKSRFV